jgi:hypothetical protein
MEGTEMEIRTRDTTLRETLAEPSALTAPLAYPRQKRANRKEILRVLERAAKDPGFIAEIAKRGSVALGDYHLTLEEKAALISGDIRWIESRVGKLTDRQCTLLNCMLQREAW